MKTVHGRRDSRGWRGQKPKDPHALPGGGRGGALSTWAPLPGQISLAETRNVGIYWYVHGLSLAELWQRKIG